MSNPAATSALQWGAVSEKGRHKTANEDAYACFSLQWGKEEKRATIMIVADGISSTTGGGQASQIAVETIKTALTEPGSGTETTSDRMAEAIALANQEILFQARQNPQWKRMGTTVVLALLVDDRLYVMGLGDSRAYLIRKRTLHRLTTDHTWAQYTHTALIQDSDSSTVSLVNERHSNSPLVRYLGNPNGFQIDRGVLSPESKEKEEYISIQSGDAILLCSDGLYKSISDDELCRAIGLAERGPDALVTSLAAQAQQNGETDDITAILLKLPVRYQRATGAATTRAVNLSGQNLRFALAGLVALLLLVFVFGYRQPVGGDAMISRDSLPTIAPPQASVDAAVSPPQTLTATPMIQPNVPNVATEERNATIPPTRVLPTVALPTPTTESSAN